MKILFVLVLLTLQIGCTGALDSLSSSSSPTPVQSAINFTHFPNSTSRESRMEGTVHSSIHTYYTYKIGPAELVNCEDSQNYSPFLPIHFQLTEDLSRFPDGSMKFCLVGLLDQNSTLNLKDPESRVFYAWVKDTTPPVALILDPPTPASAAVTFNWIVYNLDLTFYQFKVGPSATTNCGEATDYSSESPTSTPITWDLSHTVDGPITLCLIGLDLAGNRQMLDSATQYTWWKDTLPPTAFLVNPLAPINNQTNLNFTVNGEGVIKYRFKLFISNQSLCTQAEGYSDPRSILENVTTNMTAMPDGPMTLCLIGIDAATNEGLLENASSYTWIKDTLPPISTLSGLPEATSNTTLLQLFVQGADLQTYQYKVGLKTSISCGDPTGYSSPTSITIPLQHDLTPFEDSELKLCVKSMDEAHNEELTPISYRWIKDTLPPGTPSNPLWIYPTITPAVETKPKLRITGLLVNEALEIHTNATCTALYELNHTAQAYVDDYQFLNSLSPGTYNFYFRAKDRAGNVSPCSGSSLFYEVLSMNTNIPSYSETFTDFVHRKTQEIQSDDFMDGNNKTLLQTESVLLSVAAQIVHFSELIRAYPTTNTLVLSENFQSQLNATHLQAFVLATGTKIYFGLEEKTPRKYGYGFFLMDANYVNSSKFAFEVPHPIYDIGATDLATEAFLAFSGALFIQAGAHPKNRTDLTPETYPGNYSSTLQYPASDVLHNSNTFYHKAHTHLTYDTAYTLQIKSYSSTEYSSLTSALPPITSVISTQSMSVGVKAPLLKTRLLANGINGVLYPTDTTSAGNRAGVQGAYTRTFQGDFFLSLEVAETQLDTPAHRTPIINSLIEVFNP